MVSTMDELTFEEAFQQLEEAVLTLQNGQLPLAKAIEQFELGMRLVHYCDDLLQRAELRVRQLTVDGEGLPVAQPLELSQLSGEIE
ncbi:exodeoxyribonuclease VII small subunit [Thermogemmatispora carboxidivorans]|uniref:exodeoxyribonuclease VII small subunit n=1 Tax=Thermogemmatispora carboxidivorans TaxID=1382306 RepID=UPI00192E5313|nr:exodeoxyribonuclease VII small subunit [Thermogemmatispora carboxidivorans]